MKKDDGGPAFPCGNTPSEADGMSLRDWFAGMALSGILARGGTKDEDGAETNAMDAYASADAMLEEREK